MNQPMIISKHGGVNMRNGRFGRIETVKKNAEQPTEEEIRRRIKDAQIAKKLLIYKENTK